VVDGGAGTDTLSMTTASAVSFGGATTFAGKLSSFERLTINARLLPNSVNVENLGFNYVTTSGSAGTLTLNNLANNSTVVLTAAGGVTANIKNALTWPTPATCLMPSPVWMQAVSPSAP